MNSIVSCAFAHEDSVGQDILLKIQIQEWEVLLVRLRRTRKQDCPFTPNLRRRLPTEALAKVGRGHS